MASGTRRRREALSSLPKHASGHSAFRYCNVAVHPNDMAVLMKERMLVEYANKALYFNEHPHYALFMTTIHEATLVSGTKSALGVFPRILAAAEQELAERKARFSYVGHLRQLQSERDHARAHARWRPSSERRIVWLYGAPLALMHGDSEGMRLLLPADENGAVHPAIQLPDAQLNALTG